MKKIIVLAFSFTIGVGLLSGCVVREPAYDHPHHWWEWHHHDEHFDRDIGYEGHEGHKGHEHDGHEHDGRGGHDGHEGHDRDGHDHDGHYDDHH